MKCVLFAFVFVLTTQAVTTGWAQSQSIMMGYSGAGISSDLRRVIKKEKLWDKYGVNVKAIYFNSGSVLTRMTALVAGHVDAALISPDNIAKILATGCCRVLVDLSEFPLNYARFGGTVRTSMLKTQRETLRGCLLATIEGIHLFKTRPKLVYSIFDEEGIKELAVQKDLHERLAKSLREYPIPETNGIQGLLIP
jgi:ABC-type nitrate/sulfonate/bicarbonate transport system substrate-binding protein